MATLKEAGIGITMWAYKLGTRIFGRRGLHKVWPFGPVYDWLSDTLRGYEFPEVTDVDGHTIRAPREMRAGMAMWKGRAEELEFSLFAKEIPQGGTVIDVGANIGYYTVVFARAVGELGRVFAFEPAPGNIEYLEKNIAANGYKNVRVVPNAVGASSGSIDLFLSEFNVGGHQVYDMEKTIASAGHLSEEEKQQLLKDEHGDRRTKIRVPLASLDEYFKDYKKPIDFIKIDIEGAEGGVLPGMRNVLKNNPQVKLHFEFWPGGMRLFGTDPLEYLKTFEKEGFTLYNLENFKRYKNVMEKMTAEALLTSCGGNKSTNVWAVRT